MFARNLPPKVGVIYPISIIAYHFGRQINLLHSIQIISSFWIIDSVCSFLTNRYLYIAICSPICFPNPWKQSMFFLNTPGFSASWIPSGMEDLPAWIIPQLRERAWMRSFFCWKQGFFWPQKSKTQNKGEMSSEQLTLVMVNVYIGNVVNVYIGNVIVLSYIRDFGKPL